MKTSSRTVSIALAGLMATTSLGFAATGTAPAADVGYATQNEMLKTARDARMGVQLTHDARLAIFNDKPEDAKTLVDQAIAALSDGEDKFEDLMIADTGELNPAKVYLPFDVNLAMTEGFEPTEENKLALQKANGLFASDDADQAIDVLRLASVDVQVTAAQLPVEESLANLKDAKTFIEEGKYHEANLALREVENSVIVRSFGIDAIPAQGDHG